MRRIALALAVAAPAAAWDGFQGVHPPGGDGTFCRIDRAHWHGYAPNQADVHWRAVKGTARFVGDPRLFKYDGDTHAYYHHHPLPGAYGGGWCFIDGAHGHVFGTGSGAGYLVSGGVSFYIGDVPSGYEADRHARAALTKFYLTAQYDRPAAPEPPDVWKQKWESATAESASVKETKTEADTATAADTGTAAGTGTAAKGATKGIRGPVRGRHIIGPSGPILKGGGKAGAMPSKRAPTVKTKGKVK